ncbi:MAG: ATP-binding protein [Thermoanaerobaculia bacterium]
MSAPPVRHSRSLKVIFGWWFAATLLTLYGVISAAVYLHTRSSTQRDIQLIVKSEAETVASYIGSTGRLDPPELAEPERAPFTIWIRIIKNGKLLAATPGTPELPIEPHSRVPDSSDTVRIVGGDDPLVIVHHDVGGDRPDVIVEAIGLVAPALQALSRVRLGLLLGGLVVIPVAALGGRLLAARAMRPVDSLVTAIHHLDSERLGDRLDFAGPTVDEIAVLTGAFNELLARLEASVRTMRRFTADASHEIRNPLTILRTGFEVALRRPRSIEEYQSLLRKHLQEIDRLQRVVEGLLTFARLEPGRETPIVRERLDFSRLVAESAASFAEMAAERNVGFDCKIVPGLEVEGDADLLRLIGFNLIDNALKHSPDGATVEVSVAPQADSLCLVVADRGRGVPEQDRSRIFERFFRNEQEPGRNAVGGLGLSVVSWVSATHGGSVRLLDHGPGAAFEVLLPLAP